MNLLEVYNLGKNFGGLKAVSSFNLHLKEGEFVGLIGPNGAGKTTVFNLLTGIYKPTSGKIFFGGEEITGLATHQITKRGIARTFQNIRLFSEMTVLDNIRTAYHIHIRYNPLSAAFRTKAFKKEEAEALEYLTTFARIFKLKDCLSLNVKNLPYGDQRKVEIVRALVAKPKLLLLDEPTCGMNPKEVSEMMELLKFIKEKYSLTVLLIEHRMPVVMGICERIVVMDFGEIIAEGNPDEVRNNKKVIEAYLGKSEEGLF
ncbi:MAG: ABC transporter ATP-binding protein [candidate division WOR-3 bacterium]